MAVRSDGLIVMNDRDETSFGRIDAIVSRAFDRESKVQMRSHRMKKKNVSIDRPLDLNPTLMMNRWVHRSHKISVVITRAIDGSVEFT